MINFFLACYIVGCIIFGSLLGSTLLRSIFRNPANNSFFAIIGIILFICLSFALGKRKEYARKVAIGLELLIIIRCLYGMFVESASMDASSGSIVVFLSFAWLILSIFYLVFFLHPKVKEQFK